MSTFDLVLELLPTSTFPEATIYWLSMLSWQEFGKGFNEIVYQVEALEASTLRSRPPASDAA